MPPLVEHDGAERGEREEPEEDVQQADARLDDVTQTGLPQFGAVEVNIAATTGVPDAHITIITGARRYLRPGTDLAQQVFGNPADGVDTQIDAVLWPVKLRWARFDQRHPEIGVAQQRGQRQADQAAADNDDVVLCVSHPTNPSPGAAGGRRGPWSCARTSAWQAGRYPEPACPHRATR